MNAVAFQYPVSSRLLVKLNFIRHKLSSQVGLTHSYSGVTISRWHLHRARVATRGHRKPKLGSVCTSLIHAIFQFIR